MKSSESTIQFRWQINFKILLFSAVFLPLTLVAGFWQLSRADEKQLMLDEQSARQNLPAVFLQELDLNVTQNYRPVVLSGHWSPGYFLLENRVKNGLPGYEVIGVLESENMTVLVNRGWVGASYDRQQLPEVEVDSEKTVQLQGYAYRSTSKPFTLGEPIWTEQWPERVQAIDWDAMQERLGYPVFPYLVRLDAASEDAYSTGWPIVNLPPQKHTAYAVQWFALALALVVLTLFASSNLGVWIKNVLGKQE